MVELFKVIVTRTARRTLRNIFDYHKENVSEATARKVRKGILEEALKLERYPESGTLLPGTEKAKNPSRYSKAWSYKIIYRIFQKKKEVKVLDFIHDKQNPDDLDKYK